MKNYSRELLEEDLSRHQKRITTADTRFDWNDRFIEKFVMPAVPAVQRIQIAAGDSRHAIQAKKGSPTEAEVVDHRKVEHFGQVIPIEDVEQVIDLADSIARMPCGCRYITTGKSDRRYCFGLGIDRLGVLGEFPDAASSLEVLTKEEAKNVFRKYDQEGLAHSIWTGVTPCVLGICNCDRDCAAYKSYIEPTRCLGCGVCRAKCPRDAIKLVPRSENSHAAHVWLKDSAG